MNRVSIVFLGTGSGAPLRGRFLSSILVDDGRRKLLLDVGEGAQYRLLEVGVSPLRITHVIVSHLHGDHVLGLPGLLATMSLLGRRVPLTVIGPPGIGDFVKVSISLIGNVQFRVDVVEVVDGSRVSIDGDVNVECRFSKHTVTNCSYAITWRVPAGRFNPDRARALGLPVSLWKRVQYGEEVTLPDGRVVRPEDVLDWVGRGWFRLVYSGDTAPTDAVVELSRGSDVLIHESTFSESEDPLEVWSQGHSRSIDAARVALEAGVGLLVLTHVSSRYPNQDVLAEEARRVFPRVVAAKDLLKLTFRVPKDLGEGNYCGGV